MKDSQYIHIQGWMGTRLGLRANDLICFAVIYGFSMDGKSQFRGDLNYLGDCMFASKPTVMLALEHLLVCNLILRQEDVVKGRKRCYYSTNVIFDEGKFKVIDEDKKPLVMTTKEPLPITGKEPLPESGKEPLPEYNNKEKYNKKENSVSDDTPKKGATDELFDKFWEAYGKKVRKEEAIREWAKLSADNRQKALDAIEAYKESKRYETRYMLDPVRYLKRKTWNDDFSTVNRKTFYDPQEGDSDEKQRFKAWMRKTYPEIERSDFPISYEDYMMLKEKYGINQLGEQIAYINENIIRFIHRDVTWEIDNFLRPNAED